MTTEYIATKKDIEEADAAFVQRTIAQGICFACRHSAIILRKIIPGLVSVRRDARMTYAACQNPNCHMYTDISQLTTWEA